MRHTTRITYTMNLCGLTPDSNHLYAAIVVAAGPIHLLGETRGPILIWGYILYSSPLALSTNVMAHTRKSPEHTPEIPCSMAKLAWEKNLSRSGCKICAREEARPSSDPFAFLLLLSRSFKFKINACLIWSGAIHACGKTSVRPRSSSKWGTATRL